jgi:hypothetical protein
MTAFLPSRETILSLSPSLAERGDGGVERRARRSQGRGGLDGVLLADRKVERVGRLEELGLLAQQRLLAVLAERLGDGVDVEAQRADLAAELLAGQRPVLLLDEAGQLAVDARLRLLDARDGGRDRRARLREAVARRLRQVQVARLVDDVEAALAGLAVVEEVDGVGVARGQKASDAGDEAAEDGAARVLGGGAGDSRGAGGGGGAGCGREEEEFLFPGFRDRSTRGGKRGEVSLRRKRPDQRKRPG